MRQSWVQNLPEGYPGKPLLISIESNHVGAIDEPYHVLFTLSGNTDPQPLILQLNAEGWVCGYDENWSGSGVAVDAQDYKYIFSKERLDADAQFFIDFANKNHWNYEGWSVIFPLPLYKSS